MSSTIPEMASYLYKHCARSSLSFDENAPLKVGGHFQLLVYLIKIPTA